MTTQTSAPIGSTGQSLEGVAVNTGAGSNLFRESVVIADPNDSIGYGRVVSTQPALGLYGAAVWVAGTPDRGWTLASGTDSLTAVGSLTQNDASPTPATNLGVLPAVASSTAPAYIQGNQVLLSTDLSGVLRTSAQVNVTASANVTNTISTQVISSIPYWVSQSSAPWTINGGVTISSVSAVSTQVISSIPYFVSQSSAPWDFRGGMNVTAASAVMSTWPLNTTQVNIVSSIPHFVAQSSGPWDVRGGVNVTAASAVVSTALVTVGTTAIFLGPTTATFSIPVSVASSTPVNVVQSSSPWVNVVSSQIARGNSSFLLTLAANLNTTVIKASQGNLYSYTISNIGSTNVFIRFYDASTAATTIASTAAKYIVGVAASTANMPCQSRELMFADLGITFTSGISIITQQQPWTATNAAAPGASSCVLAVSYF